MLSTKPHWQILPDLSFHPSQREKGDKGSHVKQCTDHGRMPPGIHIDARSQYISVMLRKLPLLTLGLFVVGTTNAQTAFTPHPELLPYATNSGNCMGVTDMNGDGLDDIAVLDGSTFLRVLYQNINGTFAGYDVGLMSSSEQWGMALADLDNDGHKDAFSGGSGDGQHYMRISQPGVAQSGTVGYANMFMQNISIGDIDNDGWLDVFGCHDNAAPKTWMNDGTGSLDLEDVIDFTSDPVSDMSGNYGSLFTDFDNDGDLDIYIAKCRQGVNDSNDPRRWDRLFVNDGANNYTDQAAEFGVENRWQTWCVDFGDWDNDGDLDLIAVNHDHDLQFFENDGTGHFTEIDDGGLDIIGFLLECHFEDFDNDGFLDILIAGGSQFYLKGNGDGTFTSLTNVFPSTATMHSFAYGDLNNDGFMDVWSSYGTGYTSPNYNAPDVLWLNDGNGNHWLNVRLNGVESNKDGIGARVTLTTALGTQLREVRSGESYGLTFSSMCHFGLGTNTTIETMVVQWPSGQVDTYNDITADQTLTVVEGSCIAPVASISSSEGFTLCPDAAPITLTAAGGASFLWDTGESTGSIEVSTPGYHAVTIDGETTCPAFTSVFVLETPNITPVITAASSPAICWDEPVMLVSSPANTYAWSTGDTTQSIITDEPGDYTVTVDGICPGIASAPLTVTILPTPLAPTSSNVSIPSPGTADLVATGDSIVWYDMAVDGTIIGSGSPWMTPYLNAPTSFWCAEAALPVVDTIHGGLASPGFNWNTENDANFFPIFECYAPFELKSVLVHLSTAGTRLVGLVSWPDGTTISSANYDLPAGSSRIDLNMEVTPGTYGLRMFGSNIGATYNNVSNGYPYPLGDVGAITSTTNGGSGATAYFEIFYDWEIAVTSYTCEGPRTQVDVSVGPMGIDAATSKDRVKIYPVPTDNWLNIDLSTAQGSMELTILDITGRVIQQTRMDAAGIRQLDVSQLGPGEYHLRIAGKNGIEMHRFMVR